MPKWGMDVYFTTYKTIEIEADSYLEAREKGLGIMEDLNEDGLSIEGFECYRVWDDEAEDQSSLLFKPNERSFSFI